MPNFSRRQAPPAFDAVTPHLPDAVTPRLSEAIALRTRGAVVALAIGAAWLLAACSPTALATDDDDDRPVVLATFTVLADIARNVAGDHLRVESITTVGAEIHGYEPTPGDLRRAARADLILDNGLGLEAWFARFVDRLDVPHVVVSEAVETIPIADGAAAGAVNPHAWMSPRNTGLYVDAMVAAFSDLDPENADAYAANGAAYQRQLTDLHAELVGELEGLADDHRVLVTCEGAFSYLARDAGLEEAYLWPVNAEQEATPQRVASVIELVREREVPAVFCESTVSDEAMRQVSAATGSRLGGVLYVDSLSEPDGPVPTYLDLLRHDVEVIVAGLTGREP